MSVTIHTTVGDLKCEIFCDTCPRTAFNFLALAAAGKYKGTIFHRNIRGFMIQGGDTAHVTGHKSSIWGNDVTFPDEFHPNNQHDRRGRLSMANRGPNTNKVSTAVVVMMFLLMRVGAQRSSSIFLSKFSSPPSFSFLPQTTHYYQTANYIMLCLLCLSFQSQFFVLYEQQPHLNNLHTVFGQLLDGWDVLDKMEKLPVWGDKPSSSDQQGNNSKTTPLEPPVITGITIHANPLADEGITYPTPNGPPEKK